MRPPLPAAPPGLAVGYCALRGTGDGWRLVDVSAAGDPALVAAWAALEGARFDGPWDPRLPSPRDASRLRAMSPDDCAVRARLASVADERRVLVIDADRLIGWVSWISATPLSRRAVDGLEAGVPATTAAVIAWARAATHRTGTRWSLLFDAEGRVDGTSAGSAWLSAAERDQLGAWVAAVHQGAAPSARVRGLPCEAIRLDGATTRYLVHVVVPAAPRLDPLWRLPTQQRRVVEAVSVGATVEEAARHLALAPQTVRQHLKAAYESLGVGSRAEVARLRFEAR